MLRNVILALLTCSCLSVASVAQDKGRPVPPIPTTISKEAQDFLRTPPVMEERAFISQTPEEWKSLQSKAEKEGNERSGRVIKALAESVEVRQMGGVDVHIITPKTSIQRTLTKRSSTSTAVASVFTRLEARTPNVHLLPTSRA